MTTEHLRHIALHVDEPDSGCFFWVLMEEGDEPSQWRDLQATDQPFDTYSEAWVWGQKDLAKHIGDPRTGPRATGEDEDASPVG